MSATKNIVAHAARKASKSAGEHSLSSRAASASQVSGWRQFSSENWKLANILGPLKDQQLVQPLLANH